MSNLVNFVNSLREAFDVKDPDHLDDVQQVQIALGLACVLPLEEAVGSLAAWNIVRDKVRCVLDEINELFIIDIGAITDLTKEQYVNRWNMVYNPRAAVDVLVEASLNSTLCKDPAKAAVVREHLDSSRLNNTITQLASILDVEVKH